MRSFPPCTGGLNTVILVLLTCFLRTVCSRVQQGDPLGPLLFSLVLHPLALKIEAEFPNLDLCVWYLDDGTIVGCVEDVHKVFELIQREGPALGFHLNVKKKEIWWPSRRSPDPFPTDVDRIDDAGVKLLGAHIGTKAFTTDFVQKKLDALKGSEQCSGRVCSVQRLSRVQQDQPSFAYLSSRSAPGRSCEVR